MATESDPAVTRNTVILNTPDDWIIWIFLRRDVAKCLNLWQYVNPDVAKENLPELEEPPKPQLTDYELGATELSHLSDHDRKCYRWECDQWERLRTKYRTQVKAMADLNTDISKTIAVRHKHLIKDHDTPYDRLVTLKKFFCPTDATRRRKLSDKYNTLKTAPRAAKKIEQWLSDWVFITAQGKSISLPETDGYRPQVDFLIACKALVSAYAACCLCEIFRHEARGTTTKILSLATYVAEITAFLRLTKPQLIGGNRGSGNRDGVRQIPTCICGRKHWYVDCFILNTRHPRRPKNYQPAADTALKVEEARKDPKINARVKSALERWAARQPQSA